MFIPALVSLFFNEYAVSGGFTVCAVIITGAAALVVKLTGSRLRFEMKPRDAIAAVTLCWFASSLLGAAPYMVCGVTYSAADAFFESASGFTTTGATCFAELEDLPRGILLWRSLTGWLGGLEIIALTLGILPVYASNQLSVQFESSVLLSERYLPKSGGISRLFYTIYFGFTILLSICYLFGGMNFFDALTHSMGVVSTSGFSNYDIGASSFNSGFINWITSAAMLFAAMNFTLYYRLFTGRRRLILKDEELRSYLALFACTSVLIAVSLISTNAADASNTPVQDLELAVFEAAATLSTTGMRNADYTLWPPFCQMILLSLMAAGGCSASPAGGLKIVRGLIVFKLIRRNISRRLHPNAFVSIKLDGKPVPSDVSAAVAGHAMLYASALLLGTLFVSIGETDHMTAFGSVISCLGNIGSGFSQDGAFASYASSPWAIKLFLSFLMIAGRLELTTALLVFTRQFWSNDR
jgi:trk system potassium uptake protein TrkH